MMTNLIQFIYILVCHTYSFKYIYRFPVFSFIKFGSCGQKPEYVAIATHFSFLIRITITKNHSFMKNKFAC